MRGIASLNCEGRTAWPGFSLNSCRRPLGRSYHIGFLAFDWGALHSGGQYSAGDDFSFHPALHFSARNGSWLIPLLQSTFEVFARDSTRISDQCPRGVNLVPDVPKQHVTPATIPEVVFVALHLSPLVF
jgi:hypothetical protein